MNDIKNELAELRKKAPGKRFDEKTFISAAYQCCFPHLYEKHQNPQYPKSPPSYSIAFLVPKEDPYIEELRGRVKDLMVGKYGSDKNRWPEVWRKPITDGDKKSDKYPEMAGHYVITARDYDNKPLILDTSKPPQSITDTREIYPGCVVRVKFETFISKKYDAVGFALRVVQKIADAEPFGGASIPENGEGMDDLDLPAATTAGGDDMDFDF
jgi:hypothetical protein